MHLRQWMETAWMKEARADGHTVRRHVSVMDVVRAMKAAGAPVDNSVVSRWLTGFTYPAPRFHPALRFITKGRWVPLHQAWHWQLYTQERDGSWPREHKGRGLKRLPKRAARKP